MIGETLIGIGGLLFLMLFFGFFIMHMIRTYKEKEWGWFLAFMSVIIIFIGMILEEMGI